MHQLQSPRLVEIVAAEKTINGIAIEAGQFGDLGGFQIECKKPHKLPKFRL
jgi:hypothetical protein